MPGPLTASGFRVWDSRVSGLGFTAPGTWVCVNCVKGAVGLRLQGWRVRVSGIFWGAFRASGVSG